MGKKTEIISSEVRNLKGCKSEIYKRDTYIPMFIAALFTIA
jgi:hypothetical protein